jgi:hypothetical protein
VSFLAAAVIGSSAVTNVVAVTKTMNTATATTDLDTDDLAKVIP